MFIVRYFIFVFLGNLFFFKIFVIFFSGSCEVEYVLFFYCSGSFFVLVVFGVWFRVLVYFDSIVGWEGWRWMREWRCE